MSTPTMIILGCVVFYVVTRGLLLAISAFIGEINPAQSLEQVFDHTCTWASRGAGILFIPLIGEGVVGLALLWVVFGTLVALPVKLGHAIQTRFGPRQKLKETNP